MGVAFIRRHLHPVIDRTRLRRPVKDVVELRVEAARGHRAWAGPRLVDVRARHKLRPFRADVSERHDQVREQRLLQVQVPLLRVGRAHVHVNRVERRALRRELAQEALRGASRPSEVKLIVVERKAPDVRRIARQVARDVERRRVVENSVTAAQHGLR